MNRWWRSRTPGVEPEVVVVLPEPLAAQVRDLLARGERVEAVKLTRRSTRMNLLPAVRAVDALAPSS